MTNFSKYRCLVIILIMFIIRTCTAEDIKIKGLESSDCDDDSGSLSSSESGLNIDEDICGLPIDAGDCEGESLATNESGLSDNAIKELYEINDLYEVKQLYEINDYSGLKKLNELGEQLRNHNEHRKPYFGYNKYKQKCEEFDYDGCGGNDNRFTSLNKCKRTCYTPLKYFLSEVTDLVLFKFTQYSSEVPAM